MYIESEIVAQRYSVKKLFLKLSQNSVEHDLQRHQNVDSGAGDFLWIFETFKNTFFYGTPPVDASVECFNMFKDIIWI